MENNKKKYLIIGAVVLLAIILIITGVFCYCRYYHKSLPIPINNIITTDTVPNDGYYHKKPIKLELMTDTEKSSFGISTNTPERAQVLERDASGKPTVYHLIFSDSDILTEY